MDTSTEVVTFQALTVSKRQRRSIAEKRRIVEETLVEGASVARVARAHGVNANQVFSWRKQYQAGRWGSNRCSSTGARAGRSRYAGQNVAPPIIVNSGLFPVFRHDSHRTTACTGAH